MKASSVGWELFIELSEQEISMLEKEIVKGEIKVYDLDKKLGNFPLELKICDIDKNQLYVELQTIPKRVYIDKIEKYIVKISQDGYEKLIEYGQTGDRMYSNPGCKVIVKTIRH